MVLYFPLKLLRHCLRPWTYYHRPLQAVLYRNLTFSKMDNDSRDQDDKGQDSDTEDCHTLPLEDYYDTPSLLMRRQSTFEDEQRTIGLMKEILEYQDIKVCSWIIEDKVKILCFSYKGLLKPHRDGFLKVLASSFSVDHKTVHNYMNKFKDNQPGSTHLLKAEEQLMSALTPQYSWLFKYIGRLENGVKFLVDMRTDVLDLINHTDSSDSSYIPLQHLNTTLKEFLSLWFTVGFLHLERITWKSPCEMMQKISEYEAVHPVRNWSDLKRRVGAYRRCFAYTHSSMPDEPLVVLHTALSTEIASSMKGIVVAAQRMSVDGSVMAGILGQDSETEDPNCVKAAIFYSITSTQKGLQGIELGNYLIKRVVKELQYEFPLMTQFSSLSPIPRFKSWLVDRITEMEKGVGRLPQDLWDPVLKKALGSWKEVKKLINTNMWYTELNMTNVMMGPLMTACAEYLYKEKINGIAANSVANFHLRNGAVMWRLNWLANTSPHGLSNSCGMMVNYRYFLEDTETNSRNYLENKDINASDQIRRLVGEIITSKM